MKKKKRTKMEKIITATEAVREFSTILNKIRFSGDHYKIKRNGKLVAIMLPDTARPLKELREILQQLPKLDDELESFSEDLNMIFNNQPELPDIMNWE